MFRSQTKSAPRHTLTSNQEFKLIGAEVTNAPFFMTDQTTKNPAAVALGRLGGRVKSARKTEANRRNGKLGGRPKKAQPVPVSPA